VAHASTPPEQTPLNFRVPAQEGLPAACLPMLLAGGPRSSVLERGAGLAAQLPTTSANCTTKLVISGVRPTRLSRLKPIHRNIHCASLGAAVPSDQVGTGIMYSVIGSGAPANCGFNITGVPGRSAPHDLGSVSGT
jgi:hypothetical protein